MGFLGIILQGGLIGRLVRQFGEVKLVAAGFISATAGFALMGFTYHLPGLLAASSIASFGTGVLRPALTPQSAVLDPQSKPPPGTKLTDVTVKVVPNIGVVQRAVRGAEIV